jgi:hypothetical protein
MEDYLRCGCETSAEHTTVKTDTVALYTDKGIYGRVVDAEDVEAWTNVHAFTAKLFGLGICLGVPKYTETHVTTLILSVRRMIGSRLLLK